ncbi:MAG: chemotaxis protein CheA [Pseudomonadota bacterium]
MASGKDIHGDPEVLPAPDPMEEIRRGFFQECEELLEVITDGLDALRTGNAPQDGFDAAFRAVHSIKGGAAAFGLADLTDTANELETHLSRHRSEKSLPSTTEAGDLERIADRLARLVSVAAEGRSAAGQQLKSDDDHGHAEDDATEQDLLTLSLSPGTDEDIQQVLTELGALGDLSISPDLSALPRLEEWSPETPKLGWTLTLRTELSAHEVREAIAHHDPGQLLRGLPEPRTAEASTEGPTPISPKGHTIRVDLERVDRLMNLVGELVINQAMLTRSASDLGVRGNSDHMLGLEDLMRLTRDLQDSVMQIRAQPIKPLFQRMARICREAALTSGKKVELVTEGQETEIDKTVIEGLVDPLTHMIRNAVDHAIEAPGERKSAGKPARGVITLRASHRSGQLVLEITDDGAGIDRGKVRDRAEAKGMITPGAEPSDAELDHLLFMPGFSTAASLSSLSGRGVGMDVVRSAVLGLGGRISVDSTPGAGTRFEISLPLTLAVLDAMVVSVADQTLVLPLSTIHETITIRREDILELTPAARMLRYQGRPIMLSDLGEALGYHGRRTDLHDRIALIIDGEGRAPTALAIDEIHEQRQVVIKGLQEGFSAASSVSAATILGDGRIALIIDPLDQSLTGGSHPGVRGSAIPLDLSA